jgi:hypothetical protein
MFLIMLKTVNPAVTNETVTPTRKENVTTAVDREVHQDHHHTSVQPIQDREVLPEQHSHQLGGVEHRNIKHGNDQHVKDRLAAEQGQFKNTREVGSTQHHASTNAGVTGEHVHHHVHENIQPVVQKETIQPSVVHTTVPIHEVHQNEAKHHTASALPAVTMDEFKRQGGHLSGREERTDSFGGEPRSVGGTLGGVGAKGTTSLTENESSRHGHHNKEHLGATGAGAGVGAGATGAGRGAGGISSNSHDNTGKKPGLMDKLNPKRDADHDGKAGFMD